MLDTKSELLGLCQFSHLKTFITATDESGTIAPSTTIVEAEIVAELHNQDQDNLAALEQRAQRRTLKGVSCVLRREVKEEKLVLKSRNRFRIILCGREAGVSKPKIRSFEL